MAGLSAEDRLDNFARRPRTVTYERAPPTRSRAPPLSGVCRSVSRAMYVVETIVRAPPQVDILARYSRTSATRDVQATTVHALQSASAIGRMPLCLTCHVR